MVDYGVIRPGADQEVPRGYEIKRENTVEKEGEGKLEAVIWFLEHDGILIANFIYWLHYLWHKGGKGAWI